MKVTLLSDVLYDGETLSEGDVVDVRREAAAGLVASGAAVKGEHDLAPAAPQVSNEQVSEEAEKVLADARAKADEIVAKAEADAKDVRAKAAEDAKAQAEAAQKQADEIVAKAKSQSQTGK